MAIDFSWFWEALRTIVDTINTWFSDLWTQVQNITNTGQGLFAGLVAFGTQIWDAFIKGMRELGEWLSGAYKWIGDGLVSLGEWLGKNLMYGLQVLSIGFSWIAGHIYNFGNWLWNSLRWLGEQILNILRDIWDWFTTLWSQLLTTIRDWYDSMRTTLNTWFSNLFIGFRAKLKQTIIANITIATAYKTIEKIPDITKFEDLPITIAKIIINPIMGYIGGSFIAEVIDNLVPTPTTPSIEFIPPLSLPTYTPPAPTITIAPEPTAPTPAPEFPSIYPFIPTYDFSLPVDISYEVFWTSPKELSAEIGITYETVVV